MIARRTRSFSDAPLGGSIANRAVTDEALWERLSALRPMRAETVQIGGPRLPDRGSLRADVFGRRRGDATRTLADAECMSMGQLSVDSCPPAPASKDTLLATYDLPPPRITDGGGAGGSDGGNSNNNIDEDSTAMAIERALGESFGKLRGSKNMTMAFKKVARSAEGMVRRADIAAVDFGNDPKEMLILEKGAKRRPRVEPPTFSTTMTARQAAATLETICREMACKVKRVFSEEVDGAVGTVIKLRVVRPGSRFGPSNLRRLKAVITICEEDKVRTDVYLKKVVGLLPDTAAFLSLSEDIRSRFQREWPRLVDALYMRSPS